MEIYKNWLRSNGVKFEEKSYGLDFKYQGAILTLWENSEDPLYLSISMPAIWKVDNDEYEVLKVANKINSDIKAVKVVVRDNSVWLNIEMFIDSTPEINDFMDRILDILLECRMRFAFEMRNQQN